MRSYLIEGTSPQVAKILTFLRRSPGGRDAYVSEGYPGVIATDLTEEEFEHLSATVNLYADYPLVPFVPDSPGDQETGAEDDDTWQRKTLDDVLQHVAAPAAWEFSVGEGVTIALIDTGVPSTIDFPVWKRAGGICFVDPKGAWHDNSGHGAMTASVAAATALCGGKFNGVAPHAKVLACRTSFGTNDVFMLLDQLIKRVSKGELTGPLVVNASFGSDGQPKFTRRHPYVAAIEHLVSMGVFVACAAGNNHPTDVDPTAEEPDTIWGANSLDCVCCVGAVNWRNRNDEGVHAKSSRGPGQWAVQTRKPDCVGASYGEVLWGTAYRAMKWWGTSGASPQVAGLAALVLSYTRGGLNPGEVKDAILDGCRSLPGPAVRVGRGLINCAETMRSL
jgi:serine protease AprX